MAIKSIIPVSYTATQADIDAGLANNLPKGTSVIVVDANQQPIDIKTAQGGGQAPTEGSGLKNNFTATTAPTVTDDSGDGYSVGSRWIDITNDESYICLDAAVGAAVWSKSTVGTIAEVANLQTTLDSKSTTTHNHDTAYTAVAHGTNVANPHSVTKTQVGLGSVDNTADTAKPVSTAQQTALNLKQDASTAATDAELTALTTTVLTHGLNTDNPHTVNKEQVGLGLAENTSDASKPISTATQTALDAKQATLTSGTTIKTVNGATLLGSGNITTSADLAGGSDTTITNEGLVSTGADSVDTTTVPGETIIRYIATTGTAFTAPLNITSVRVLAVAGGGGGGVGIGGGGGAGGVISSSSVSVSGSVTVTVGTGGAGRASDGAGTNGGNSVFGSITATGGGGGGGWTAAGQNGGSGGGGNSGNANFTAAGTGTQGSAGGAGEATLLNGVTGGGGGGGGGVGAAGGTAQANGVGGIGISNDITGVATFYGGGGGAGLYVVGATTTARLGGNGGGGTGNGVSTASVAGTASTGGGGGGNQGSSSGAGGSGVVIVRFATQTRTYQALQNYANNAAAITGGLLVGQFFNNTTTGGISQVV